MEKTDILIFDVGLGQSIFIYPHSHPEYGMLVDCGHTEDFHPVDFLIKSRYIQNNQLSELAITNYDHDHFSSLPYLQQRVTIKSVHFAPNLTSSEIKNLKEESTEALELLCSMKDRYTQPVSGHTPPYNVAIFYLEKHHFETYDTNNLSQIIFIEHFGSVVCISADLEENGWKTILKEKPGIIDWLKKTNIFIASHHGRKNGYCPEIFNYCSPECIIISDKGIVHDTQRNMSSIYGTHINGNGIELNGEARKVLTTRDDGHIWIQLQPFGSRIYKKFRHD